MNLKTALMGVAIVAVIGLAANGLVAWKLQGVLENDISHLKSDVVEIKEDVDWLVRRAKEYP